MSGIDAELTNFVIACSGILIGIISAISTCMIKSRCTNIRSPCITCDRDVLSEEKIDIDVKQ